MAQESKCVAVEVAAAMHVDSLFILPPRKIAGLWRHRKGRRQRQWLWQSRVGGKHAVGNSLLRGGWLLARADLAKKPANFELTLDRATWVN